MSALLEATVPTVYQLCCHDREQTLSTDLHANNNPPLLPRMGSYRNSSGTDDRAWVLIVLCTDVIM